MLVSLVTDAIGCKPEELMDMDLHLADCQPAVFNISQYNYDCYYGNVCVQVIGGALNEFIFAPRLDNLFNCFTGLRVFKHTHTPRHKLICVSL